MAGYLVFDVESVPDGDLIVRTKYPGHGYTAAEAISQAEREALDSSDGRSDFIPLTYHIPVAVGLARLGQDLSIKKLRVLSGTEQEITNGFWQAYEREPVTLVSFNGRTFDLPVLELMALKHSLVIGPNYWAKYGPRNRFGDGHIDLMEWVGNFGAHRVVGGLDLLAKLIGRSGKSITDGQKMDGKQVLNLYREGKQEEIDNYCACDVLDTYGLLLRTRVIMGQLSPGEEAALLVRAEGIKPT